MNTGWMMLRPWRNRNPGDLRTLPSGQRWSGQTGTDDGPGGPFAQFGTEEDGWAALCTCLLAYQDLHGLHTIRGMIGRFAPALENDTGGYVSLVARETGKGPDAVIDAHVIGMMVPLVSAIALAEGGPAIQWSAAARLAGVNASLRRGVTGTAPPAPMRPATRPLAVESDADLLNDAQIKAAAVQSI